MSTIQQQESVPGTSNESSRTRALLAAVALLAVSAVAPLAFPVAVDAVASVLGVGDAFAVSAIGGMLATLSFFVLAFAYLRLHPVTIPVSVPSRRGMAWIAAGLVISLVIAILGAILESALASGEAVSSSQALAGNSPILVYGFLVVWALFVIGPAEEFLFRGVVQGRLRQNFGAVAAIGITSVGFAIGHVPSYWIATGDVFSPAVGVAILGIALGSVVLGAIYERTGNLAVVVVVHSLTNALLYAIMLALVL